MHSKEVLKKKLWTRGQWGYPQVTCRGRVEALGIRIESGRQKVLPVRRLDTELTQGQQSHLNFQGKAVVLVVFFVSYTLCHTPQISMKIACLSHNMLFHKVQRNVRETFKFCFVGRIFILRIL